MDEELKIQNFTPWDNEHKFVNVSNYFRIIINNSQNNINDFRLYRYNQFHYLHKDFEEQKIVFISPKKWNDPFESKCLLRNDIFCICTKYVSNINEEASWVQYSRNADSPLVRLSLKLAPFLKLLNDLGTKNNTLFYIGVVDYSYERKQISKFVTNYKRNLNRLTVDMLLSLMCLKRKAFAYEKEIRIFAIPQRKKNSKLIDKYINEDKLPFSLKKIATNSWKSIIGSITLPPIYPIQGVTNSEFEELQKILNGGMEDYLRDYFSIQRRTSFKKTISNQKTSVIINSALYRN